MESVAAVIAPGVSAFCSLAGGLGAAVGRTGVPFTLTLFLGGGGGRAGILSPASG